MAVELVKHTQLLLVRERGAILLHPPRAVGGVKLLRLQPVIDTREKAPHRRRKATVVHGRIFHVVLQPLARIAKMFAEDKRLRVYGFGRAGDPLNVAQVCFRAAAFPEHMHHIEPPAVDAPRRFQPVLHHALFARINLVHHARLSEIELRQAVVAEPAEGMTVPGEGVPVARRRIRVMARPVGAVILAIEPRVRVAGVVKDAVQNQAHTRLTRFFTQAQQRLIAAELRIDVAIIGGVVFMHARRAEDGVEVERRDAEFFQVRQFFADTVEIATVKRRAARLCADRLVPVAQNDVVALGVVEIDIVLLRAARRTAGEAVRENLIEHLILHPLRAVVGRVDSEQRQPGGRKLTQPQRAEPLLAIAP
ncbi:hypothetical protein BN131_3281 [Cronobacter malonaticus 681]|nr:hypothetical protein BN131_3281 [Cronobacter malonaticus 681]